jgi:hypothetical protein
VSLTSCLDDLHSPISQFLAGALPSVAALAGHYRARLPLNPHTTRPVHDGPVSYRTLGQAIDLRLRTAIGAPVGSPVTSGIVLTTLTMANVQSPAAAAAVAGVGQQLVKELNAHPPAAAGELVLDQDEEERLARMCFVASWFEEVYRSGMRPSHPLLHADLAGGLDSVLEEVPDYVPADIAAQAALADQPTALQWILHTPPDRRMCGPTFAGSHDVGGADADLIVAGRLIDCKATIRPKRIGRDQLYQLAGYLLLDYDDTYGIERVGLYLSRQGRLIEWDTDEFLSLLCADRPLAQLREACREALTADPSDASGLVPRQAAFEQDALFGDL